MVSPPAGAGGAVAGRGGATAALGVFLAIAGVVLGLVMAFTRDALVGGAVAVVSATLGILVLLVGSLLDSGQA
jgi:ABC-type Mn2+/Zn2+ transport system permease subunit